MCVQWVWRHKHSLELWSAIERAGDHDLSLIQRPRDYNKASQTSLSICTEPQTYFTSYDLGPPRSPLSFTGYRTHRDQDKKPPIREDAGAWRVRGCGLSGGSRLWCWGWLWPRPASWVSLSPLAHVNFVLFPGFLFSFAQVTVSSLTSRLVNRAPSLPNHTPGTSHHPPLF